MMEVLEDRIKKIREAKGLSTTELGKRVGKGQSTISNIETGKTKVKADEIELFAEALNVSSYYLLTGVADKNRDIAKALGLSNKAINKIKKLTDKQKALLEMLLLDEGSITDPDLEPEYGFMDALANYVNDPVGNRIVDIIYCPDAPHDPPKVIQAPHRLRIRLADGSIHEVSEWKPDSRAMLNRLKTIRAKYLRTLTPMQYIPIDEEEDDE